MLDITEITALKDEAVKAYRDTLGNKKKKPAYNQIYEETVELAEQVAIHAELDTFPEMLFRNKAPNEDENSFQWRKDNYQAFTRPAWARAENTTQRIWNEQNYSVTWKDGKMPENVQKPREYFEEKYPVFGSLISYFKLILTKYKLRRPNAVACIRPHELPTLIDDAGEEKIADNQLIEPCVIIYREDQVIKFKSHEYAFILLDEKSIVSYGNTTRQDGLIFELYDDENIWHITQVGKQVDYTFEISIFFTHALGYLPASKLKGVPEQRGEHIIYKSPFGDAITALNEALYDASSLQACKVAHAFPQKWEYVDVCDAPGCNGGKVWDDDLQTHTRCTRCKGEGTINRASIFGVYQLQKPTRLDPGDGNINPPPGGYITPDPAILEFLNSQVNENINRFYTMLNIDLSKDQATGKDTATGRILDREELFSFLINFSSEVFDLLEFSIKCIGDMRYGSLGFEGADIKRPNNFSIRSEQDLTAELATAKADNLPQEYIEKLETELVKLRFPNSDPMIKRYNLIMRADALSTMSVQDISTYKAIGGIYDWQIALHNNIGNFIEKEITIKPEFLELPFEAQEESLIARAKLFVEQNKVVAGDVAAISAGMKGAK